MAPDNYILKSPLRKFHEYDDFENDFFKCFSSENDNKTFESFNSCFNIKEKDEFLYREINYTKLSNEIKYNNLIKEKILEEKNETKFISDKEIKKNDETTHYESQKKRINNKNKKKKKKSNKKKKTIFNCFCGKNFNSKENYNLHYKNIHLNIKPYQCDFCKVSFSHRNGKIYHERIYHTFIFPYVCKKKNCQKSFASHSALNYHMKTKH